MCGGVHKGECGSQHLQKKPGPWGSVHLLKDLTAERREDRRRGEGRGGEGAADHWSDVYEDHQFSGQNCVVLPCRLSHRRRAVRFSYLMPPRDSLTPLHTEHQYSGGQPPPQIPVKFAHLCLRITNRLVRTFQTTTQPFNHRTSLHRSSQEVMCL